MGRIWRRGNGMHVVYDLETYPNFWSMVVMPFDEGDNRHATYEISTRVNHAPHVVEAVRRGGWQRMYGYNSMPFDYPLLHYILHLIEYYPHLTGGELAALIYRRAQELIANGQWKPWENHIKRWERVVSQCDLMSMNHFDRRTNMVSLKTLEFNIGSPSLEELPFPVGTVLTWDQMDLVLDYNRNDTRETKRFAHKCIDAIRFREKLIADGTFDEDCLNWNDTKIGEKFFLKRLEQRSPGITKRPVTRRSHIALGDVIVPYVQFERPELRDLVNRLRSTVIAGTETKNAYQHIISLDGFEIAIGAGGIHGSVNRRVLRADRERLILDIDVTGYYPSVAIVNNFYPAHIGPLFVEVYREIRDERAAAKKAGEVVKAGTLKLATNGAFGKTGSPHSPLSDPQCMLAITLNGQLLQCVLAEALLRVPGLELVQMNTDGLTVTLPRHMRERLDAVCDWWQRQTCLELEFVEYQAMWVRDVNNYLALDTKGKIKRKGAYDYEMVSGSTGGQKAWNKDFSALVVPRAAEAALVHDQCPADFIAAHREPYDFLLRAKVTGASRLEVGGRELGKTLRYYIATSGAPLIKIMPPLAGKTEPRRIGIHAEGQATCSGKRGRWECDTCGHVTVTKGDFDAHNKQAHAWPVRVKNQWDGDLSDIDYRWYVREAENLLF